MGYNVCLKEIYGLFKNIYDKLNWNCIETDVFFNQ